MLYPPFGVISVALDLQVRMGGAPLSQGGLITTTSDEYRTMRQSRAMLPVSEQV